MVIGEHALHGGTTRKPTLYKCVAGGGTRTPRTKEPKPDKGGGVESIDGGKRWRERTDSPHDRRLISNRDRGVCVNVRNSGGV